MLMTTLASCGADPDDSLGATTSAAAGPSRDAASFPANGERVTVVALDNNFLPEKAEIVAGTEVVFKNNGRNPHNVVPADDPKATTWGVLETDFMPTQSYSRVFDTPGTYVYYCTIHGSAKAGMVGSIVVTEP
jgi:plastocyanin